MSRCYRIVHDIREVPEAKIDPILEAIEEEWEWNEDEYEEINGKLADIHRLGVDFLGGGMSVRDFSRSLARSIWRANEGYCWVGVAAFSLDDPTYGYAFEEDDWRRCAEWVDGENDEEAQEV